MARDQGLLQLAQELGVAVLRLYTWEPYCISFGRNEPALRRYNRAMIENGRLDCVRRPTGGRAVWHARELTYAVAAPVGLFGSLPAAYQSIHHLLAAALATMGAPATLASAPSRHEALDAGACFASPAGGEVMVAEAKLIGSAQLQQGTAFLQHGSVLLEDTQATIQQVTLGEPPDSKDRPLAAVLGRPVSFLEAADAIESAALTWTRDWSEWRDEALLARAAARYEPQFQSPEWTWRR